MDPNIRLMNWVLEVFQDKFSNIEQRVTLLPPVVAGMEAPRREDTFRVVGSIDSNSPTKIFNCNSMRSGFYPILKKIIFRGVFFQSCDLIDAVTIHESSPIKAVFYSKIDLLIVHHMDSVTRFWKLNPVREITGVIGEFITYDIERDLLITRSRDKRYKYEGLLNE